MISSAERIQVYPAKPVRYKQVKKGVNLTLEQVRHITAALMIAKNPTDEFTLKTAAEVVSAELAEVYGLQRNPKTILKYYKEDASGAQHERMVTDLIARDEQEAAEVAEGDYGVINRAVTAPEVVYSDPESAATARTYSVGPASRTHALTMRMAAMSDIASEEAFKSDDPKGFVLAAQLSEKAHEMTKADLSYAFVELNMEYQRLKIAQERMTMRRNSGAAWSPAVIYRLIGRAMKKAGLTNMQKDIFIKEITDTKRQEEQRVAVEDIRRRKGVQ